MSNFLSVIEGYMSGNGWEDLCVKCYRIRYQSDHYVSIPATQGGDAGIEGYTMNGIVHQCYCPERTYSENELYEHQRDKLTKDIEKLMNNSERLRSLGVPTIIEWHFNIPEYKDSRILTHAEVKRNEVLRAKFNDPNKYMHISDDFKIIIKTAEDFKPEISRIVRTTLANLHLNYAVQHTDTPDWSKCGSQQIENIRRKIKAVMLINDDSDDALQRVINIYIDCYINGIEIFNNIRTDFPEIYEEVYQLEQSFKRDVSIKTLMNRDKSMNKNLFDSILNEFQEKLEKDFSRHFTQASIGELKQDMVASWLAECSMEFWSD